MSTFTEKTINMSSTTEKPNTSLWLKAHAFARKHLDDASICQIVEKSTNDKHFSNKTELMNVLNDSKNDTELLTRIFDDMELAEVETETSNNTLDTLPNELITNICGFLNRTDIGSAKITCVNIGIRALLEMDKFDNIGVINVTAEGANLFTDPYIYERLAQNITKKKALRLWSDKYNIPIERLFVFQTRLPDLQDVCVFPGQVIITYYNKTEFQIARGPTEGIKNVPFKCLALDGKKVNEVNEEELLVPMVKISNKDFEDSIFILLTCRYESKDIHLTTLIVDCMFPVDKLLSIVKKNKNKIFKNKKLRHLFEQGTFLLKDTFGPIIDWLLTENAVIQFDFTA